MLAFHPDLLAALLAHAHTYATHPNLLMKPPVSRFCSCQDSWCMFWSGSGLRAWADPSASHWTLLPGLVTPWKSAYPWNREQGRDGDTTGTAMGKSFCTSVCLHVVHSHTPSIPITGTQGPRQNNGDVQSQQVFRAQRHVLVARSCWNAFWWNQAILTPSEVCNIWCTF